MTTTDADRKTALDFRTWAETRFVVGTVWYDIAEAAWQAASAAHAKRIAELDDKKHRLARIVKIRTENLAAAEQRLATEHANGFAACREMAAKVAEGTLGWSEAGDTRAHRIAAAIRALIATAAETEKK